MQGLAGTTGSNNIQKLVIFYPGAVPNNMRLLFFKTDESLVFSENLIGSQVTSYIHPTDTVVFKLYKNETQVGTISLSSTQNVTIVSNQFVLVTGDTFSIVSPSVVDNTLSDITFTILTTRIAV